jgi:hypothetical protein
MGQKLLQKEYTLSVNGLLHFNLKTWKRSGRRTDFLNLCGKPAKIVMQKSASIRYRKSSFNHGRVQFLTFPNTTYKMKINFLQKRFVPHEKVTIGLH